MEEGLDKIEAKAGPYGDLIDLIVERARASVAKHETRQFRIDGCLAGLDYCAEMRECDIQDFELELIMLEQKDEELRAKCNAGEIDAEEYWQQRCATAQVEHCYEILRAAHLAQHGELPDGQRHTYSARSASQYNIIATQLSLPLLS